MSSRGQLRIHQSRLGSHVGQVTVILPDDPIVSVKNGFLKYQIPGSGFGSSPWIMNPHAPEFMPKRAWHGSEGGPGSSEHEKVKKTSSDAEKAELARQILLSFIVKSVHYNSEVKSESEPVKSDGVMKDSAIIKILYGNEEMEKENSENNNKNSNNNNKSGDEGGFVMVTKRRRNKQQFTSGVSGLYGHTQQQSVSASVR